MSATTNPTNRIFGNGTFEELGPMLGSFNPSHILLVLGEKSFRNSSYYPVLQQMLGAYKVTEAFPVSQNPHQEFIEQQLAQLKNISFDLVVAVGGGSVLDTAKLYAVLSRPGNPDLAAAAAGATLQVAGCPLIAIPTTSGTGSEVTPYASLETKEKKKITIGHPFLFPSVALVDPELTYSMPAYVTACTGFDALSQAIESFWAVSATPLSQSHALRSLEMIVPYLKTAVESPLNAKAREAMAMGSCEAGLAIAHTKTTAVHSVSYPMTAHFNVAHGHACALTLAEFVRFNEPVIKEKGRPMLRAFQVSDYESMAAEIEKLMQQVKLERSLAKLGIDEGGRKIILRDGFRQDRILNNPRPVTAEELEKILQAIA